MRINHTKGEFKVITSEEREAVFGDVEFPPLLICDERDGSEPWCIADLCTCQPGEAGDAVLLAHIAEVPHECDDPKCPGNINRQKLEMFDEMLSALRETRNAMQIAGSELTCNRLDSIITRARALQETSK